MTPPGPDAHPPSSEPHLRAPTAEDGKAVHDLIARCPPLDGNSLYCNLLQCSHFADTCVLAEVDGQIAGFISAYRLPRRPATLFVWQVAVSGPARGRGLARRMLLELLAREACAGVDTLETTITPDNRASWSLFTSLARALAAPLTQATMFDRERHFQGGHASEMLVRIGPFTTRPQTVYHRRRTA